MLDLEGKVLLPGFIGSHVHAVPTLIVSDKPFMMIASTGHGAWQPEQMIAESHQEYMEYMVGTGMTAFHAPAIVTPNATNVVETMVDFNIAMEYLKALEDTGKLPMRTFTSTTFKTPKGDPETIVGETKAFQNRISDTKVNATILEEKYTYRDGI